VHNTVTVDRDDQMKMVSRFTWTNWSKGKTLAHDENIWQGEHNGYKRLADPVNHKRTVLSLWDDRWLVVDHLNGKQTHHYSLQWLLNDFSYQQQENLILLSLDSTKYKVQVGMLNGKSAFSVVRADPNSTRGWRSRYYGDKEPAISAMLETDQSSVCFWTFFGPDSDLIELVRNILSINSKDGIVEINLGELNK
jgi:hypothetical protein